MIDVKPILEKYDNKPVAVFGLGLSGLAVVRAFLKSGATVYAYDDSEEACNGAHILGAQIKELTEDVLKDCAFLCLAPGVPLTHPEPHRVVKAANQAECKITCDIQLLNDLNQGRPVIALTGTNGKSTTTTLIQHVLTQSGENPVLAGNIGLPVFDTKSPSKGESWVLELSSFQLDLCDNFKSDIAIILNLTADHLDRHGSMGEYIATKEKIFEHCKTAIIGVDDDHGMIIYERLKERSDIKVIPISVREELEDGVYVKGGTLFDSTGTDTLEIGSLNNITKLHGLHNKQNSAAVYAACVSKGLEDKQILDGLKTYPGLPHRQFPVRIINGVAYINDSKATNAEATSKALVCNHNIYWIAGGIAKDGGLNGLDSYMDRVKRAFLIGDASDEFEKWLLKYGVEAVHCATLERAVEDAHKAAQDERGQPGGAGVVLLSPACASYDQFKSFEERGDVFTSLVENLDEESL